MREILECDLLLPNADPSLQKPTAPDIFICQRGGMFAQYSRLAHNKSYIKRYSRRPLPSQRRRQPKQRGEALQVLQATSILDILLLATSNKALIILIMRFLVLGKPGNAKMDDFLEKIQTPPHIFGEKTYSLGFWGHASL